MAVKIKSIAEATEDEGLKCLVHGRAGSGKTVLCATTGKPTLILSAEAGLLSIKDAPDYIKVWEIESIDDIEEAYEYLTEQEHDFEWLALDSISEIGEQILTYEKAQTKDPRQAYGALIDRMTELIKAFRDLPHLNVIVTCKQTRQEDSDTGRSLYMPSLPGARLANDIPYLFDEVFALRVEKDEEGIEYRTLQTNLDNKFVAKDRSGKLDEFEAPSLKKIFNKIYGTESKPVKKKKEPKVVGDGVEEPKGKIITKATKKMYFHHEASDDCFIVEKGDELPDDIEASEITKKSYNAWEEANAVDEQEEDEANETESEIDKTDKDVVDDEPEQEPEEVEETLSTKITYWKKGDKLLQVDKGEDIGHFLSDDNVEQISKVKFVKLSNQ